MANIQKSPNVLKLSLVASAAILAVALGAGSFLPSTVNKAHATVFVDIEHPDAVTVFEGRKKKKRRKRRKTRTRRTFGGGFGGAGFEGGGGSYHTNPDEGSDPERFGAH